MTNETAVIAVISYLVFLFSTVCHEMAHALVARLLGDDTAYHNGQVTLNPWPHIRQEPFGLGIFPLISLFLSIQANGLGVFGFASAPFDPDWAKEHPKRAAWMALAGPGMNFLLATLAVALLKLGVLVKIFLPGASSTWQLVQGPTELSEGFAVLLSVVFFENLLLGVWNLLPIPPMDGFSGLLLVLPEGKVHAFFELRTQLGMIYPMAMFAISGVFWRLFDPLLDTAIEILF
ncbi:MAG: site-2 protease family protein [Bryobacteraceae bacterium]